MMKFFTEADNGEVGAKNVNKRPDARREASVAFHTKLIKIEETDETPSKSSGKRKRERNQGERARRKDERPKSAGCVSRRGGLERICSGFAKRPQSTEKLRKGESGLEMKRRGKEVFEVRETPFRGGVRCECATVLDFESRYSSFSWGRPRSCLCDYETNRANRNYYHVEPQQRRCRSNPNFSKTTFEKEKDLVKMKRSLRLIGLELSDLGIYSRGGGGVSPPCKWKRKSSVLSTKVTGRSVSLESLRDVIRRAWVDDQLDESHRRLLSQAAYEEWYLRKEKELQDRQGEERRRKAEAKESIRKEFEKKKAMAEEEFRKWLQRKKMKRREKENVEKRPEHRFGRVEKTKQDSEAAFLKWKTEKDKELEKKQRQKKKEEEKKMALDRQKNQKKITAEKAFQQWKIKFEENKKTEEEKRKKMKKKLEELERRQKREEGSQISFQIWKEAKDEEIRQRIKQIREITKLAKEERQARMEERMYEAEQAFEDWLEKVDLRQQREFCDNFQRAPWIPA